MPDDPAEYPTVDRTLKATDAWNRLNKALVVSIPKNLARSQRARLRLRKLR